MKVLVLGSGARESAIAQKVAESKLLTQLFISPGNPGMEEYGETIDLKGDFQKIKDFVLTNSIEMVIVGPEQFLVDGIWDFFNNDKDLSHVLVVGPSAKGAKLEGSKDFAKEFMIKNNIPTAKYKTFYKESIEEGKAFLTTMNPPYVLKADGLAAGKGVLILDDLNSAQRELEDMLGGEKFGNASKKVVIEEYLDGIECSVFILTDGDNYKILPVAKDYKRIGEGDKGLNTGGMGSVSPVPFADEEFISKVEKRIIIPTVLGLKKEEIPYQGFIFIGLMKVGDEPYVIEYNVRMGDPETETVFPRIKSDILETLICLKDKSLNKTELVIDNRFATCVMLVAEGYPGDYRKGDIIDISKEIEDGFVFHAGTKRDNDNNLITSGGRVIAVTCFGNTLQEALDKTYSNINNIDFKGKYYRKDIGKDL